MLFCAGRAGDFLNAFVGLWLVPKYVNTAELGALKPLTDFATFLAIPVIAFANTFRNELSRLSIGKKFGQLKTLMRSVFTVTAIFLFIALVVSRFLLPMFLERIRIVEGSLGLVIIATSFVGAVAPIYSNAIQALKKFKAQSLISVASAPLRLIVMLITMPFRAVTGYFVGQASVPSFNIVASIFSLRKELSVPAESYWTREIIHRFARLFAIFAAMGIVDCVFSLVESTVLRQRLPDLDSAGYYMATRFSEIANFLSITFAFTIFPFAAEKHSSGDDVKPLIKKSLLANACFCFTLATLFFFFGRATLGLLPCGDQYASYWWSIPWLIGIAYLSSIVCIFVTTEFSANRFGFLKWYLPLNITYSGLLLLITGYGYYSKYIPHSWVLFLDAHNVRSLSTMLWWMTAISAIKATICLVAILKPNTTFPKKKVP